MDIPPGVPPPNTRHLRIKLEFTDDAGAKYTVNIEGNSRQGLTKIMDLVDSLKSQPPTQINSNSDPGTVDTNFARLYAFLHNKFTFGSFTSKDVLDAWNSEVGMPTSLSIISTYLTRLAKRGLLARNRLGSTWIYKMASSRQDVPTTLPEPPSEQPLVPSP